MKIQIDGRGTLIGKRPTIRRLILIDNRPVYLANNDFHIILVLGIAFNRCKGMYLRVDQIHQSNTPRYIYRLKNSIAVGLSVSYDDIKGIVTNLNYVKKGRMTEDACYRLDVDSVEISPMFLESVKQSDGRISQLFSYLDKQIGGKNEM